MIKEEKVLAQATEERVKQRIEEETQEKEK